MAIKMRSPLSSEKTAWIARRHLMPILLGSTLASTTASAVEFQLGEIEARFDSQISVGASWRQASRDDALISVANGGSLTSLNSGSYDDGDLNFDKGDAFTQIVKGVHDLELRYKNLGAFVRGKYWYDVELSDNNQNHGNVSQYEADASLSDEGFNDYAQFSGAEILDAYVFGEFDIGDQTLDLRLGRQVINWGESTFVQGGINVINPFDVSAFRRPGAEIKEGLLPVNMAFASLGLTDNLSAEAFYQLQWQPTAVDGCGTYFSTNDFGAEGCDGVRIVSPTIASTLVPDATYFQTPLVVSRNEDGRREADDDGQFGLALRYFAEELNSTEFGLYFSRYHSRLPLISGINTAMSPTDLYTALVTGGTPAATAAAMAASAPFMSEYFVSYPENTNMVGLSFATNLGDVAWSGEISHKTDVPVQINGPLLVGGILKQFSGGIGNAGTDALIADAGLGGEVVGYSQFDVTQLQNTFIKFYDRVLGASRLTLIGEVAWTHVHDLDESADAIKYGRAGAFGYTAGDTEGFVTQNSWGYVARANLSYPNAFAGVNLTPQISFKHGVKGYGPQPGAAFNEGEKSLSLSLTADYLNRYSVQLAYTDFFGGDFNALSDRDFISLSASVSF
ncbi:MAG: DUF1302 domain-containing protein [Pontibacterium sp.]